MATAVGVLASSCGSLAFVAPLQARGSLVDVGQSWTCRVPAAAGSASSRLGRVRDGGCVAMDLAWSWCVSWLGLVLIGGSAEVK